MESFTREEQRFVLAEMIKSSNIDIDNLIHFVKSNTVSPDWMVMQLPQGRNMKQCMTAVEQLSIPVQYPRRESPNGHYEAAGSRPASAPDRPHLLSPTMRPSTYTHTTSALPPLSQYMFLPRPENSASYASSHATQPSPSVQVSPPGQAVQTHHHQPTAPVRRKRGRPSRTEIAKRDLRPLLPQHLMNRSGQVQATHGQTQTQTQTQPQTLGPERPILPALPSVSMALSDSLHRTAGVPSPPSDNGSPAKKRRRETSEQPESVTYKSEHTSPLIRTVEQGT